MPIYTKITEFSTWWRTGTTLLEKKQECQVCLEDFQYLKPFHCRKPLSCKTVFYVFKYVQMPAGSVYSFKVHVAGGEVNIVWSFAHAHKKNKMYCIRLDNTVSEGRGTVSILVLMRPTPPRKGKPATLLERGHNTAIPEPPKELFLYGQC